MKKNRPTICILDNDKERCLRQEQALDRAIAEKKADVTGVSNFGPNSLARSGLADEQFPALEVEGVYFTPKAGSGELTFEMLCDFIDMLRRKGVIS